MVQILSGLITYLLLAIYCQEQHGEPVSIARVLQLRTIIRNEAALLGETHSAMSPRQSKMLRRKLKKLHASP